MAMKKIKFSKSKLNLWVETASGDLKLVKIPVRYRRMFVKEFGTEEKAEKIPKESEVADWLFAIKILS
jgi:hypothetical protein